VEYPAEQHALPGSSSRCGVVTTGWPTADSSPAHLIRHDPSSTSGCGVQPPKRGGKNRHQNKAPSARTRFPSHDRRATIGNCGSSREHCGRSDTHDTARVDPGQRCNVAGVRGHTS